MNTEMVTEVREEREKEIGAVNKRKKTTGFKCQPKQCFLIIATGLVPKSIEFHRKYNSVRFVLFLSFFNRHLKIVRHEECIIKTDETTKMDININLRVGNNRAVKDKKESAQMEDGCTEKKKEQKLNVMAISTFITSNRLPHEVYSMYVSIPIWQFSCSSNFIPRFFLSLSLLLQLYYTVTKEKEKNEPKHSEQQLCLSVEVCVCVCVCANS